MNGASLRDGGKGRWVEKKRVGVAMCSLNTETPLKRGVRCDEF